jgi:Regulator of chromosome condensation (RCC1) repeat
LDQFLTTTPFSNILKVTQKFPKNPSFMPFFRSVKKALTKPFFGFLVVGILINSVGGYFLYQRINEAAKPAQALIANTWSVFGDNTSGLYCDGSNGSATNPRELGLSGDIVQISQGVDHVVAIRNDNTLKVCGNNSQGQLGNGTTINQSQFIINTALSNVVSVVAANQITYALTGVGDVYEWGNTVNGQLLVPTQITGLPTISSITSSDKSLLALTSTGDVYGYGINTNGELGNNSNLPIVTPALIDTGVSNIECSEKSCGIIKAGNVYTSGDNTNFELGDGIVSGRQTFTQVAGISNATKLASSPTSSNYYALKTDNTVWSWGDAGFLGYTLPGNINSFTPTALASLTNVQEVSGGFPLALKTTGEVYTWTNTTPNQITSLATTTTLPLNSKNIAYIKSDLYNPLEDPDITGLTVSCNPGTVNGSITCTFVMPSTKDLPPGFIMAVGNISPGGICSLVSTTVTCLNVPIGTLPGNQPISIKINSGTPIASGETVFISATTITGSNIANQSGVCSPNPVDHTTLFSCTFPLTGSTAYSLPAGGLRATGLATAGSNLSGVGSSDPCIIVGNDLVCANTPTIISSNALPIGTNEIMVFEPLGNTYLNKASITVQPSTITQANIQSSTDCTASLIVQVPQLVNCTFALTGSPTNSYQLPVSGITAQVDTISTPSPNCIILNNSSASARLSCTQIPTSVLQQGLKNVYLNISGQVVRGNVTLQDFLENSDLTTINISCFDSLINTTTTCAFNLPSNVLLPINFRVSVGNASPNGSCNDSGGLVTCTQVPVGSLIGSEPIYADLYPSSPINTGQTALVQKYLENTEMEGLEFSCSSAQINQTTNCSFQIPLNVLLPAGFLIQIGLGGSVATCSTNLQIVTCSSVPTGSDTDEQSIFAGTGNTVTTGDTVLVTRIIDNSDIVNFTSQSNFKCLPNPVSVYSTVNCSARFPRYLITSGSNILVNLQNQGGTSCSITARDLLCSNIQVGPTAGIREVLVTLNNVTRNPGYGINVSSKIISDFQLDDIGNPSAEQILYGFSCGIDNIVYAGKKMKCTATIVEGWVLQSTFKLGVGTDPAGSCTLDGSNIICVFVPIQQEIADDGELTILNSVNEDVLTGILFKVIAAPSNFDEQTGNLIDSPTLLDSTNNTPPQNSGESTLLSSIQSTIRTGGLSTLVGISALWGLLFGLISRMILKPKRKLIISL